MKISFIGDSIRLQYEDRAKELLGDTFEVFAPAENCRFAKYNLRGMWDWKDGMNSSRIVHWNCGLWDICDIFGDGLFTDVDEYVKTVSRIADILLSRHEKVIFATTTPVRYENKFNDNDEIKKFNAAVIPMLKEKGVIINDLHSLIYADVNKYVCDDLIHLSAEGIELCAKQVAESILSASKDLPEREDETKNCVDTEQTGAPVKFRD